MKSVMVSIDFAPVEEMQKNDSSVPVFDTTYIHAETAVEIALGEKSLQMTYNFER